MKPSLLLLPILALASSLGLACSSSTAEDEVNDLEEGALSVDEIGQRGESQVRYPVPGRPDELCIIPKKSGGAYSPEDLADEKKLCGANLHSATPGKPVAICPKNSSTNPGIYVTELDGKTKAEVERAEETGGKYVPGCRTSKVGTLKQSVTCSYTGAIIGYYHLSRLLGGVASVPVSVGRTLDLEKHKEMVVRGLAASKEFKGGGFDVYEAWEQYQRWDANPASAPRAAQVYTSDFKQIYGAFQDNAKDNGRHPILRYGGGAPGLAQFLRSEAFVVVSNSKALKERFPNATGTNQASIQGLILAKDTADMVLMDELLGQQDRYGNIESQAYKMFEEGGQLKKVRLDRRDEDEDRNESPIDRPEVPGMIVHELLLRDNDCGVSKTNLNAEANGGAGVVGSLAHMSSRTYKHFRWFAAEFVKPGSDVHNTFARESFFAAADLEKVGKQATKLAATLKSRCESGKLQLDADLRDHRAGTIPGTEACGNAEAPPAPSVGTEGGLVDSHGIEGVKRAKP